MMKTMVNKRKIEKKDKKKMITIVIVVLALMVGLFLVINYIEHRNDNTAAGEVNDDILDSKEKVVDDVTYTHKRKIHTYLFIGVDMKGEATGVDNYYGGGQGDVQMIITFDDSKRTWQVLQLNRDAMVDVDVLGIKGDVVNTVVEQLALAHSYGNGKELSCENNVNVVSRMLEDENIEGYFALNMDAINILNEAVGGVTVNNTSDFSKIDTSIEQGIITLQGSQAETFVRSRLNVDDETNGARMKRQREFLNGLLDIVQGKDANFGLEVYNKLSSYVVSNIDEADFSKIFTKLENYSQKDIVTISGDLRTEGEHWAYYQSQTSLNEAIVEMFYDIKESD